MGRNTLIKSILSPGLSDHHDWPVPTFLSIIRQRPSSYLIDAAEVRGNTTGPATVAERSPGLANRSPGVANPSPGVANPSPGAANPSPGLANRSPEGANRAPGVAHAFGWCRGRRSGMRKHFSGLGEGRSALRKVSSAARKRAPALRLDEASQCRERGRLVRTERAARICRPWECGRDVRDPG